VSPGVRGSIGERAGVSSTRTIQCWAAVLLFCRALRRLRRMSGSRGVHSVSAPRRVTVVEKPLALTVAPRSEKGIQIRLNGRQDGKDEKESKCVQNAALDSVQRNRRGGHWQQSVGRSAAVGAQQPPSPAQTRDQFLGATRFVVPWTRSVEQKRRKADGFLSKRPLLTYRELGARAIVEC